MSPTQPVTVVGAGISGIACARSLARAGIAVQVLDRGRRIGGRMAVRTRDGRPTDIGASYFTVSDPGFQTVVSDWERRGLARPWTDTFHVYDGALPLHTTSPGQFRWGSAGGLRTLVEDLAEGLDVRQQTVTAVGPGPRVDDVPASAVVLAMPDPQARRLLHPDLSELIGALDQEVDPVLALTTAWPTRQWDKDLDGVFVNSDDDLSWIADDGRRRGDDAPVLVAHSTAATAARFLDRPQEATEPMLDAVRRVLQLTGEPQWTHLHRWSFGKPAGSRTSSYLLTSDNIGVCGDGWSDRPRVEAAYLSGLALAEALIDQLRGS